MNKSEKVNELIIAWKNCKDEIQRDIIFEKICSNYTGLFMRMKAYNIPLEDWMQECKLEVFLALEKYESDKSTFMTYVYWQLRRLKRTIHSKQLVTRPAHKAEIHSQILYSGDFDLYRINCLKSLQVFDEMDTIRFIEKKLKFNEQHLKLINLLIQGYNKSEIGKIINVSKQTVSDELFRIQCKLENKSVTHTQRISKMSEESKKNKKEYQAKYRKTPESISYQKEYQAKQYAEKIKNKNETIK